MAKQVILIVDDDRYWARHYIEALRAAFSAVEFEVVPQYSADDAINILKENDSICAVVLDIMMPVPKDVDELEVDEGQLTGVFILKECRDCIIKRNTVVFVLTNARLSRIISEVEKLEFPDELLEFAQKYDVRATLLPEKLRALIHKPKRSL